MKKMLVFLLCLLVLCLMAVPGASAADISVRDEFAARFAGFTGTFVMYDPAGDKYIVYNRPQSKTVVPLFHLQNLQLAHRHGNRRIGPGRCIHAVQMERDAILFPLLEPRSYPGIGHPGVGGVVLQELAARISPERMQEYIDKIGYGNKDISGGLTTFWLGSSLQISALEQVDLLNKLYSGQLAFSAARYRDSAKNITLSEDGTKLMGKTGSALRNEKWVSGWFVGCVNKDGRYYVFATNIEAADGANGGKAREITKSILKMGIL